MNQLAFMIIFMAGPSALPAIAKIQSKIQLTLSIQSDNEYHDVNP
jgi:hypothetical protein